MNVNSQEELTQQDLAATRKASNEAEFNKGASTSNTNSTSECSSTVKERSCIDKNAPHYSVNYQNMVKIMNSTESDDIINRAASKKQYRHPKFWERKYSSYEEFVANHEYFKQKDK